MRQILKMLACPIWVTMTWGVVFLLCGCDKEKVSNQTSLDSVEPEICLKQHLGLSAPESAENVKCHVEALMVKWLYARLDIPCNDLPDLLLREPLNRLPRLSRNPDLLRQLQVNASQIWWWQKSEGENIAVSQSTWRKSGKSSDWQCTLSVCTEQSTETVTVYLQYNEEPVSHDTAPEHNE